MTALVDLVDMIMAKSEPEIAANYDQQLVAPLDSPETPELMALGDR